MFTKKKISKSPLCITNSVQTLIPVPPTKGSLAGGAGSAPPPCVSPCSAPPPRATCPHPPRTGERFHEQEPQPPSMQCPGCCWWGATPSMARWAPTPCCRGRAQQRPETPSNLLTGAPVWEIRVQTLSGKERDGGRVSHILAECLNRRNIWMQRLGGSSGVISVLQDALGDKYEQEGLYRGVGTPLIKAKAENKKTCLEAETLGTDRNLLVKTWCLLALCNS